MIKERVNYYVVKQNKGILWAFFHDFIDGICCMTYTYDSWSKKQIIFKEGTKNFSVYLDNKDMIYLFCQDTSGNILLYQHSPDKWVSQILLYSKTGFLDSLHFDAIIQGDNLSLFYNLKDPNNPSRHALVQQVSIKNAQWNAPSLIDYIKPLENRPFSVYKDSVDNIFLFYQKGQNNCQLGYKKQPIETGSWSEFYSFAISSISYTDNSILLNNNTIHSLYIKQEKHYSTLFYRPQHGLEWKEPQRLFEKPNISSCSLFMMDNHLWAAWVWDGKLYSSYSTDFGNSFSSPSIHLSDSQEIPIKTHYQSNFHNEKKHLCANEIYIYSQDQIKFLIIPDIFPALRGNSMQFEETFVPVTEKVDTYLNEIKFHLSQVYEEVYLCKKQLREKDSQIAQLKYTLKVKNQDFSQTTYEFRKSEEGQKNELLALKERTKSLEKKLKERDDDIKVLEEKIVAQKKGINILKQELELRKAPLIITTDENNETKRNKTSLLKRLFNFEEEHTN
ncbi:MAG: hypothetical protein GX308_03175 [Epulopiscium sp.]|nr:hypothetical protein [Candidatus Epulonipiscium sp.]